MRRARRRQSALLVGVAALVVLALWQWRHDRAAAPGTLLALDPSAISRIDIAYRDQPPQSYAKRDGHWWRTSAAPARADDDRLDAIAALAATPVLQWRAAADFDAAKIGLDPPALVLALDGQRIAYGALAVFGPQRYVRVGGRIALIAAQDSPRPPRARTESAEAK